jgi:RHS repeat-associated protein
MSLNRRVRRLANGNVVVLQGTNRRELHTAGPGGVFVPPVDGMSVLVQNPDGTYTLTSKHGGRETYDINGNLSRIEDKSGDAILLTYDPVGLLPVTGPSAYFTDQTIGVLVREYQLSTVTDAIGNVVSFHYGTDGRLSSITYLGRTVSYTYTPEGDLATVTTPATPGFPAGHTTEYTYLAHNLRTMRDPLGITYLTTNYDPTTDRVTSQTYQGGTSTFTKGVDGAGNTIVDVLDRKGFSTRYTFDTAGHVTRTERFNDGIPAGEPPSYVTTYVYDSRGELLREVHPRGNALEFTRDTKGNVTSTREKRIGATPFVPDPTDLVSSYTYEALYNLIKTSTDAEGRITTYTYDYELGEAPRGLLRTVDFPSPPGQTVRSTYLYDSHGELTTLTDPNGNVTSYVRSPTTGYVTQVVRGVGTTSQASTTLGYDVFGNLTSVTNAAGGTTVMEYDGADQVIRTVSPAPSLFETNYRYDANGRLVQTDRQAVVTGAGALPALGTTSTTDGWQSSIVAYTIHDEVSSVTDELGGRTEFTYDANGNVQTEKDPNGAVTTYTHDERDDMWKTTDAQVPAGLIENTYDANGNLTSLRDANGNITTYQYDDFDRLTRMTYPGGSFEQYGYDRVSNVTSRTTAAGVTITYVHDVLNRLTTKITPSDTSTYGYDAGGRLVRATNAAADVNITYDSLDRPRSYKTQLPGIAGSLGSSFTFDASNNVTGVTYADGTSVTYRRDSLGRMGTVKHSLLGDLVGLAHDPLGNLLTIKRTNGAETTNKYDVLGRLESISHTGVAAPDDHGFKYDALGNRKEDKTRLGTHFFNYDPTSQLTSVTRPAGYAFPNSTFQFDAAGNRTQWVLGGVTTNYTPDNLNRYGNVGGIPYLYDGNGNLAQDGVKTYTHDEESRLVGVSGAFGTAQYQYDALGRRVTKTVNGVTTHALWAANQILHDVSAAGTILSSYVYGDDLDQPLARIRGGNVDYFVTDGLGSITQVLDGAGNLLESYAYDAFGTPAIFDPAGVPLPASAIGNRYLYTGREYDAESELYSYRNRHLSPKLGRFIERDPLGYLPDTNLYRYVDNCPLSYTDPWGFSKGVGQPGFLESLIPVWGSARAAIDDFQNGHWASGLFNSAMAISDCFMVGAVAKTVWKAAEKVGVKGLVRLGGSQNFRAAKSWMIRRGWRDYKGQPFHHWLIPQGGWGKHIPSWIRDQPWNMMRLPETTAWRGNLLTAKQWHDAIEGKGKFAMNMAKRLWYGSPGWAKPVFSSAAGHAELATESWFGDEGEPDCD